MTTTYTIGRGKHEITGTSFLSVIMQIAHMIRRNAAKKFSCKSSEIVWSECVKCAWMCRKEIRAVEEEDNTPFGVASRVCNAFFSCSVILTPWERSFCRDLMGRIQRYGKSTAFSEKQVAVIERIADKLAA